MSKSRIGLEFIQLKISQVHRLANWEAICDTFAIISYAAQNHLWNNGMNIILG